MYNVPILFLIFARPDTTIKVFERIRQIQPAKLYIAADAPRIGRPDEVKCCEETRRIVDQIDWPCEVHTLFRDKNLGCKIAVSSAITWFFSHVEYGVILEDDCLPDLSFFPYCEELLLKYKDDDRIGHISGQCFFPKIVDSNYSYDYSRIAHIWGWASWKRVWKNYNLELSCWETIKNDSKKKKSFFINRNEQVYFTSFISDTLSCRNGVNTWDIQYMFMLRNQNQLSIYPSVNLVTNIGLNSENATHTKNNNNKYLVATDKIQLPLKHPVYVYPNKVLDEMSIKKLYFSYKRFLRYVFRFY